MSPDLDAVRVWDGRFPRVSGDEPLLGQAPNRRNQFSPRERG